MIESEIKKLTFIHDCDLTDGNIIAEKLPNAKIKFDPNHLCKENKKLINQICSEEPDMKDLGLIAAVKALTTDNKPFT